MRSKSKLKKYNTNKIIHVDMDCFYASVEIRDRPELKFKPVAVAGSSQNRGVVTTCNYIARKFGIRSAMPSITAKKMCPDLVFLPVNMDKYRNASYEIRKIYKCYTRIIEPISLDEAYLDVTKSQYCDGNPDEMARQIRKKIFEDLSITASAGISSNKFLAKVASEWNKPNGQFSIADNEIKEFVLKVPLRKIHGIGEKTEIILNKNKIRSCEDLQRSSQSELINMLGKYGNTLFYLCRGVDHRKVESNKISKSLSVEDTYENDLININQCMAELQILYLELIERMRADTYRNRNIKACFIKIKYNDFKQTTSQISCLKIDYQIYLRLLKKLYQSSVKPIRLLGVGVLFDNQRRSQLNLDIF